MSGLPEGAGQVTAPMHEWERFPKAPEHLTGVELGDDAATQDLLRRLSGSGRLVVSDLRRGVVVDSRSYVGRVTIGNLEVTIQPKLAPGPLLRLLRYAYRLGNLELFELSDFDTSALAFQDLLICQLAAEMDALRSRGLRREYTRRDADLGSPRGRLDIGRLAREGGVRNASLPCTYFERREDTPLNRTLLAGVRHARGLTEETSVRARLGRAAAEMAEGVTEVRLTDGLLRAARRARNRLSAAYVPALTLIELLHAGDGISLEDGAERLPLRGFLFDMNRFFQALLSTFLRENLPGRTLQDEYTLRGVMAYDRRHNPRGRPDPTPRPDYVVRRGTRVEAVLDAKYRDSWETEPPAAWLYQLAVYALAPEASGRAAILYPTTHPDATEACVEVRDPAGGNLRARVALRPVRLDLMAELVAPGSPRHLRSAFAAALVGG